MTHMKAARGFVLAVAVALALVACSRGPNDQDALSGAAGPGLGAAAPGSAQEFTATIGDRVFFDTDSTELNAAAQATLDSRRMAHPISALRFHRRGPRRRTRHSRI